jgi:non-heme Fe2+,alpha-ketoglutarate-dependent halogenase
MKTPPTAALPPSSWSVTSPPDYSFPEAIAAQDELVRWTKEAPDDKPPRRRIGNATLMIPEPPPREGKLLDAEKLRRYEETGIAFPMPIASPSGIKCYQEGFQDLESRAGGVQKYTAAPHLFFPWAWDLATLPRLLDAAEDLIGPELVIESSLLLCKYPHDPAFAPWHQDGVHSAWYKSPSVSAWIAIVDATPENGCMQVIPGSHRSGRAAHAEIDREDSLFGPGTEIDAEVDESQAVCVALAAGETSFHHSSIVHGSPSNRSSQKRLSLIVRFVTPLFREPRSPFPAARARSSADLSHMTLLEILPAGEPDECFARWQAFASQNRRGSGAKTAVQ